MNFSFDYKVDSANRLLICEAAGDVSRSLDLEHMLKTLVKMAGKSQVKSIVLDVVNLTISYPTSELALLMVDMKEKNWLGDVKIARIARPEQNVQNLIGDMAAKLDLPIKNFETRSEAMLWLLFDKKSEEHG